MYARYFDPTKRGQTDTKEQGSEYESDVGVVDTPLCSDAPAFDAPTFDDVRQVHTKTYRR
jgi:hypothetical protein